MARLRNHVWDFIPRSSKPLCFVEYILACGGNAHKAIVLCSLLCWSGKGKCRGGRNGWFYKSYADLEKEAGVKQRTLKSVIRWMKDQGFLETKVRKVRLVRTVHFRIDFTKLRVFMKERKVEESRDE